MPNSILQANSNVSFRDLKPLGLEDQECFDDMRAVLVKHDKLDRFGVCLLHDIFPIGKDEILKEYCDEEARTLTTRPVKKSALRGESTIDTVWNLSDGAPIQKCAAGKCD